jgi:ribosome biogenesis GTPase / thiamine phosphate phosphatase
MRTASRQRRKEEDRPRDDSLDFWMLRILEMEPVRVRSVAEKSGVVVWSGPKGCRALCGTEEVSAEFIGRRGVVGDYVTVGLAADESTWRVTHVSERKTKLARPDPATKGEHIIVANVDLIAIVVSLIAPPLHPRLIDRYFIAIQHGGAEPLLVVNKVDLASEADRAAAEAMLAPYAAIGLSPRWLSANTGEGIHALRAELSGQTVAFVGHSGVGKSSVVNALYPELAQKTGAVSEGYGRGTHTTTASGLFEMPNGTRLIDTPGVRSFGLAGIKRAELRLYFPEFAGFACRFRDCSHQQEPACAVREAAKNGEIAAARYDTYLRLMGAS